MNSKKYFVQHSASDKIFWQLVNKESLNCIREESIGNIPQVRFALLWNEKGIHGKFEVNDNSVLAVCTKDMMPVWEDSCVEIFLRPKNGTGHLAFEFNCIGTLFAAYIKNEKIINGKFAEEILFTADECKKIERKVSLAGIIYPEKEGEVFWSVEFLIPFSLVEKYFGEVYLKEKIYFANFFKCGDKLKKPHWISWNKLSELNFHVEKDFGEIILTDTK
jgi:hypothetical protein